MWSRTCISLTLLLSLWLLMVIASSRTCPSTFRALLISDVHDDVAAVRRLRSLLERQGALSQIDVVLSPGDLTTTPCSRNNDVQRAYERPAKRMLEELAAFGRPVFFVPGNHDPLFLFNQTASATEAGAGVHNAHGRTFELAAGLRLLGWGGGSAAFEDGKRVWEGWPYAETEVASGLAAVVNRESKLPDASLLMLTHCGPSGVSTSAVTGLDPDDPTVPGVREHAIDSGSPSLRATLQGAALQQRTAVALHGHTHAGLGTARLGGLTVTNPGSLRYGGYFGVLTLQREARPGDDAADQRRPRWSVLGVEQLQMSSCGGAAAGINDGALGRLLAAPCEAGRFSWRALLPALALALVGLVSLASSCHIARLESCRSETCHSPLERAGILGRNEWW